MSKSTIHASLEVTRWLGYIVPKLFLSLLESTSTYDDLWDILGAKDLSPVEKQDALWRYSLLVISQSQAGLSSWSLGSRQK